MGLRKQSDDSVTPVKRSKADRATGIFWKTLGISLRGRVFAMNLSLKFTTLKTKRLKMILVVSTIFFCDLFIRETFIDRKTRSLLPFFDF